MSNGGDGGGWEVSGIVVSDTRHDVGTLEDGTKVMGCPNCLYVEGSVTIGNGPSLTDIHPTVTKLRARLTRLRTILESEAADPVGLALREMRGWE